LLWLATFDHPHGPGHPGFDNDVNLKIYNKLTSLRHKDTAITYIKMAVEFDGWGAGRHLIIRYNGFSKQRQRTLRHTIENLRHTHGTSICTHIDLFEKLCTQMSLNDPANPPTEEQKIDWFLDTVTEKTYDSVNATCSGSNIAGTLTFNKLVKLYTHKCFSCYPQFQITELMGDTKKSPITNSSTTVEHGRRQHKNYSKGKGQGQSYSHSPLNINVKGEGKGKGLPRPNQKGKGKGNRNGQGQRHHTKAPCAYCQKDGHEAREYRKRLYDEKHGTQKKEQTNNSQNLQPLEVNDETTLMFRNNATFTHACYQHHYPTRTRTTHGRHRS
jgi:hypothetical protein